MVNYQQGKIYKIVCNTTKKNYIGSTTKNLLSQRLAEHLYNYRKFLNKKYQFTTSFEIIKNSNYEIILIENYPCNSKDQLHARERYWIELTECVNRHIPTRTRKEYKKANKEKLSESNKKYIQKNKEKQLNYYRKYYEANREKKLNDKKKYRKANKQKILDYQKNYYEINKEKINEKAKEKYVCECGSVFNASQKARHFKSLKHKKYENSLL